jgi:hemolysin III
MTRAALEEVANSVTHGIGLLLSIAGLVVLVTFAAMRSDTWAVVGTSVFGASLVLLYLASTLYHSFPWPRVKRVFQILDHSAIYILIAGTYTPFTLGPLRGPWGWTLFGILWGLAILGIAIKPFVIRRFAILSVLVYIAMGWMIVIAAKPVITALPMTALVFLLAGGLAYTGGTAFYGWKRLPLNHAVWHLFVLAGSVFHYFAVWISVIPPARPGL